MTTTRRKFFGKLGLLAAAAAGVKGAPIKEVSCNNYTRGSGGPYKCVITPNVKEYTLKSSRHVFVIDWSDIKIGQTVHIPEGEWDVILGDGRRTMFMEHRA